MRKLLCRVAWKAKWLSLSGFGVLAAVVAVTFFLVTSGQGEPAATQNAVLIQAEPLMRTVAPPSPARTVDLSVWSPALNRSMPVLVYLPAGYETSSEMFPVLYMLHGLNGNQTDWQRWSLFDRATELIAARQIRPMIIVTPAGDNGYWIDQFNSGPRYGSYVSKDLVAYIDSHYHTVPNRSYRAIGGMSMGAHGALQLALNNTGTFSIVGAHSLVLRTKQQAFPIFGDDAHFRLNDPVSIVSKDPNRARSLRLWIDIGTSDSWFQSTNSFHNQLDKLGISHSWHAWEGGHDSAYCSSHITDYLRYYGEAFAANPVVLRDAW